MKTLQLPTTAGLSILSLTLYFLSGCKAIPDHIITTRSPDPDVFYTVETTDGHGPLNSSATNVYAHLNAGGKSARSLVLHGLYLENTQVVWTDKENVNLCLAGGLTSEYHNEVTLNAGDAYRNIHNHLKENC